MEATKLETAKLPRVEAARASNQALLMRMKQLCLEKKRKESRLSLSAELAEMRKILMISGYQQLFGGSMEEATEMSEKLEQCELEKCAQRYFESRSKETLTPLGAEKEETGERRTPSWATIPIPSDSPLNYHQVVETSIEEFNDLLDKSTMSEEEKNKIKVLRRKGKNRQAASRSKLRYMNEERDRLQRACQYLELKLKLKEDEKENLNQHRAGKVKAVKSGLKNMHPSVIEAKLARLSKDQRKFLQDILGEELTPHGSEEIPAFKKKKAGGTGCCGLSHLLKRLAITIRRRSKASAEKKE